MDEPIIAAPPPPAPNNTGRNILIGAGVLAALWFGGRRFFGKRSTLRPNLETGRFELKVRGECIGLPSLFAGPPRGYCPGGSVVWTWEAPKAPAPGVRLYLDTVEGAEGATKEATRKLEAAGWNVREDYGG